MPAHSVSDAARDAALAAAAIRLLDKHSWAGHAWFSAQRLNVDDDARAVRQDAFEQFLATAEALDEAIVGIDLPLKKTWQGIIRDVQQVGSQATLRGPDFQRRIDQQSQKHLALERMKEELIGLAGDAYQQRRILFTTDLREDSSKDKVKNKTQKFDRYDRAKASRQYAFEQGIFDKTDQELHGWLRENAPKELRVPPRFETWQSYDAGWDRRHRGKKTSLPPRVSSRTVAPQADH